MEQSAKEHQYHLFYGLKDGQLKHITEVENGIKCKCVCAACEKKLVARNKGLKRIHHFAHYESAECKYGVQTSIHIIAKEILERMGRIKIPNVTVFLHEEVEVNESGLFISNGYFEELSPDRFIYFDKVILEKRLHKFIPDVVACIGDKKLIIEIAVTHFVGRKKLDNIIDSEISAIEIDLSEIQNDFKVNDLEQLIIENVENKKWLHNQFAVEKKIELQKKVTSNIFEKNQNAEKGRVRTSRQEWYRKYYKKIIIRKLKTGKTVAQAENCPLRKREFEGKVYANVDLDCKRCGNYRIPENNSTDIVCLFDYFKRKSEREAAKRKQYGV